MKNLLTLVAFLVAGIISPAVFSGCAGTPVRTVDSIKIQQLDDRQTAAWEFSWDKKSGGTFLKNYSSGAPHLALVTVPQDALEDFSGKVSNYNFFEMEREHGESAADSGNLSITISMGEISKTVTLHSLESLVAAGDYQKLDAPSRALEIVDEAISWTDDETVKKGIHGYNMRIRDAALRNPMMFHHPNFHNW